MTTVPTTDKPLAGNTYVPRITVPSALIIGPAGTGKSHLLTSALEHGKKLFVLCTEANSLDTILNSFRLRQASRKERKLPPLDINNLMWKYIPPATLNIDMMRVKGILANTNDVGDLQKLGAASLHKKDFQQFIDLLRSLGKLTDDRTGREVGNIGKLNDEWVLALDSLTSLTTMVTQCVKGIRPTTNMGEIGVIQELIQDLVNNLTSLSCFFIMTAHIERETDEIVQKERVMASTIGRKLSPKLPLYFSEVVRTYTDADGFWGTTIDPDATVKARYYPRAAKFHLDLGPLIKGYEENKKMLLDNVESVA